MNKAVFGLCLILVSGSTTQAHNAGGPKGHHPLQIAPQSSGIDGLLETPGHVVRKQYVNQDKNHNRTSAKFVFEPTLPPGKYTYIVELNAPSVLQVPALRHSLEQSRGRGQSIKFQQQQNIKSHVQYLQEYQQAFLNDIDNLNDNLVTQYEYVLNGVALRLSQADAQRLSLHPKITKITRETIYRKNTDQGPTLVGAPQLWEGNIGSLPQTQGEGVVVGIIDSGINSDHPSFAERSGDGYVHTNPLGDGVYLGDCAGQFPELCNNKLIGVYSYPNITNSYSDTDVFPPNLPRNGEDYDGHGSHVAATAVGNVLNNLPETLPTQGQIESDGTPTGFTFAQISGVAPRANLISYQVCFVGRADQNDTYAGCPGSAINRGIEDAIRDGVDVINFSISGGGDPWRDSTESAFLTAQSIGIFVATSAGNSGPGVSSSVKHSPWYTSVAASEHGRQNALIKQITNFRGGLTTPSDIIGQSNTGSITGAVVYAGDFTNSNDPTNDSAQCLEPFPANTFNGLIVVCDRGEIARVEKAENVRAGGASGYILANIQGGETFLANDSYVIPGIHINADDGDALKQWLASGIGHRVTITEGSAAQNIDQARVDVLARFSSRGPNTTISTLNPTMTAPGVDIYSAYADQRFGHDGHEAPAGDFNYLSGTSMSSPHVAGAAALLKSLHPNWTPDNIRSALAMTAVTSVRREDASTPADFFDMGSGRIRVDLAAQTGLVLDETSARYIAAEPARGGDPRTLNLPSITDNECATVCTWTRTFTATKDGVWNVSGQTTEVGLNITVSPTSFSIQAGQTQIIEVSIDTINADKNRYVFGQVNLSSNNSPDLHLPVSVLPSIGDIPTLVTATATRDADSILIEDIDAITLNNFILTPYALTKATKVFGEVSQDSDNSDYVDNLNDGVVITEIAVEQAAKRLIVELVGSSAPDLDLYLVFDDNDDGVLSGFEEIAASQSGDSTEEIQVDLPDAGRYFIVVQSFTASASATDSFELRYAVVTSQQDNSLAAQAPSSLSANVPFNMRILHQLDDAALDDDFYGAIEMGTSAERPDNLGLIAVDITRGDDDIVITGDAARVSAGDTVSLGVLVSGNTTNEERSYVITIPEITGTRFTNFGAGTILPDGLRFVANKLSSDGASTLLSFDLNIDQTGSPGPIAVNLSSEIQGRAGNTEQQAQTFTLVQVEGSPTIDFNGNPSASLNVFEGQALVVPITVSDPNQDNITLNYTQTAGPAVTISQNGGISTLNAPNVDENSLLSFDVQASDGNGNTASATFTVNVINNEPPVIDSISAPSAAGGGQQITITVNASDPESDVLTISINGVIGNSFSTTTPRSGTTVSYGISVSDGINTVTDSVSINLTQTPINTGSSGGGGSSLLWLFLLSVLAALRRPINVAKNSRGR
ncbi:S8 family serine peptidase [Glaciecola sp. SC05]|uniref:S8 family serine peptidase n=1 Tax=Glaciecola sp. SC05 TaxID=1987355 RepID=UPI003528DE1F